jgi:DNA-binding response OmpR family regulator
MFNKFVVESKITDEILADLETGNVSTIWIPRSHRTKFASELWKTESSTEKVFIYLDFALAEKYVMDRLYNLLANHTEGKNIESQILNLTYKRNIKITIVLDNVNFDSIEFLKYLISLRTVNFGKLNFLFIFGMHEFYHRNSNYEEFGVITDKIYQIPAYTKNHTEKIVKSTLKTYTPTLATEIYKFSGGIAGLVSSCVKALNKEDITSAKDFLKITKLKEMQASINSLWQRYTPEEQMILLTGVSESNINQFPKETRYLTEHGLISDETKSSRGSWISFIQQEQQTTPRLKVQNNQIYNGNINISQQFSSSELAVLKAIISNQNRITSKEEIAKLLWPGQIHKKYSDWAIDKVIYRTRKKLEEIKISGEILQTIRDKGYVIQ